MKYQEWKKQLKPESKFRKYQHIDTFLDLDDKDIFEKVIQTIEEIKKHQFLPFIKRTDVKIRFRKNKEGQVRRSKKLRPIMYASHIDAHIYSYYNFMLQEKYEEYLEKLGINKNITAYRKVKIDNTGKGKSNIHFASEIFKEIENRNECVVITQDIEGFFDNLNHSLLKRKICETNGTGKLDESFYKVFRSLTAYKYIEHSDFIDKKLKKRTHHNKYAIYNTLKGFVFENKTKVGIPQGSPISGLLANIYLIDFDLAISMSFPDVFYRRYSDDLLFICRNNQKDDLIFFIDKKIRESMLKINASKSYITYFTKAGDGKIKCEKVTDGLGEQKNRSYVDYLGFEFSGEDVYLRKNTIQKLKGRQIKKSQKYLLNTITPIRRNPKKGRVNKIKNRNNYFKKALDVFRGNSIQRQILRVVRDRNKLKKSK